MPFRRDTWRHLLRALLVPLVTGPVLALQPLTRASQDSAHREVGPLSLLLVLVAAGIAGPVFEHMRLKVFFGAPGFFFVDTILTTLSFATSVGWVIVSARNLTYPVWGWEPCPTDAEAAPARPVRSHSTSPPAWWSFLTLPWAVMRITGRRRVAVRRFAAEPTRTAGTAPGVQRPRG